MIVNHCSRHENSSSSSMLGVSHKIKHLCKILEPYLGIPEHLFQVMSRLDFGYAKFTKNLNLLVRVFLFLDGKEATKNILVLFSF